MGHLDSIREQDAVRAVYAAVTEGGDNQLVPAVLEKQHLVVDYQFAKMWNPFCPQNKIIKLFPGCKS